MDSEVIQVFEAKKNSNTIRAINPPPYPPKKKKIPHIFINIDISYNIKSLGGDQLEGGRSPNNSSSLIVSASMTYGAVPQFVQKSLS